MNDAEIKKLKKLLEDELTLVESELKTVGRINPESGDWEPTSSASQDIADRDLVADDIEEYEENTAILSQLEIKYNEIKSALKKIEEGKYGICEIGGELIEISRLEANPSAKTCIKHMNS